jgi:hypothetical protein
MPGAAEGAEKKQVSRQDAKLAKKNTLIFLVCLAP